MKVCAGAAQAGNRAEEETLSASTRHGRAEKMVNLSDRQIRALIRENARLKARLREAEEEIRYRERMFDTLVGGSRNLIGIFSGRGFSADFFTDNVEEALGLDREALMQDCRVLFSCTSSPDAAVTVEDMMSIGIGEGIERMGEFRHQKTGETILYQISLMHILLGDRDSYILFMMDKTTEDQLGQRVREILDVVEGSSQAKSDVLAAMSHDFRVPISSITGYVTLLRKNPYNPEKVLEYAGNISISCQTLMSLLNHVLEMSRAHGGNHSLDMSEFSLQSLTEDICGVSRTLAASRNISFTAASEGVSRDVFLGDRGRIREILMNLITNAVTYTRAGGHVEFTVRTVETPDPEFTDIVFEVRDDGIGMSDETLRSLYEPFGAGRRTTSIGTGLGLAVTKKLVELMDGQIQVASQPGKGSVFTVTIRLQTIEQGNDDFWKDRGISRILIIDENIMESARIQDLLEGIGIETVCTTSGYGGLQLIEQARMDGKVYDIVLLDMNIQGMSGLDVARSIQTMAWVDMPALFLMAAETDPLTEQARKAGILALLAKPFYVSALRRIIEDKELSFEGGRHQNADDRESPLVGLHFLAAEDNMINADILKELLEMEGARVEIAGNGLAAVAMFRNSRPGYYDMILMDVAMPIMDGYEATRQIRMMDREDAATIPILAMTANTFAEDIERSFQAGMNAHITKPLDIRDLNSTIRRLQKGTDRS